MLKDMAADAATMVKTFLEIIFPSFSQLERPVQGTEM
jgi:hypothetical protein